MPTKPLHGFSSALRAHIRNGESQLALHLYEEILQIKNSHSHLNPASFVSLLRACAELKDSQKGHTLHSDIARKGLLDQNLFVGNALLDMYAKCGDLNKAKEVFDRLPFQSIGSWNALIYGYAKKEHVELAFICFEEMQDHGISPNVVTFVYILKACCSFRAIDKGIEIHAEMARIGLMAKNVVVGNALIDFYAKFGFVTKAQEVFDDLSNRDIVSWTTLIAGYTNQNSGTKALYYFGQMLNEGIPPNAVTFVCCLNACTHIGSSTEGKQIHAQIAKLEMIRDNIVIGNSLVDMYAKCGLLANAQEAFDDLCIQDVVSWTSLISGYAKYESGESALECFERMKLKGVSPNAVTYVCSLTACGRVGETLKGEEIHAETVKKGVLYKEIAVGNALVDMYGNCGLLMKAQEVFDVLPLRDVITWNALMSGYARHEYGKEALKCFSHMQLEGVAPDVSTLVCGLKACATIGDIDKGREIHMEISRRGCLEKNVVVGSALVDMYSKCGYLRRAREVLDNLLVRDVISWNALISGYVKYECGKEAIACFEQMQDENISPDAVTFVCTLKACGSLGAIKEGREIHVEISKQGLLERDGVIGSALVDMYAKCGLLQHAQEVFDKLIVHDTVSWTALIAGYANNGHGKEALNCFNQMQSNGLCPNVVTYVCGLKACGSIGAIEKGQEIHAEVDREGLLESDVSIGNALADMYMKCGLLVKAQDVFDMLPSRDVNSWNALIAGYAKFKHGVEALRCFEHMQLEGVMPDSGTFVGVLVACCHGGLVEKGQTYLEIMTEDYGISPTTEHHICMVSLLARAGHLDMALKMAAKMQSYSPPLIWDAMLTGCEKWGNMEVGRFAFENESKWIDKST